MDIDAQAFQELKDTKPALYILDVRTPAEFNTYNIGGTNIPISELLSEDFDFSVFDGLDVVAVCAHGLRSKTVVKLLQKANNCRVKNLKGGLTALNRLKNPG